MPRASGYTLTKTSTVTNSKRASKMKRKTTLSFDHSSNLRGDDVEGSSAGPPQVTVGGVQQPLHKETESAGFFLYSLTKPAILRLLQKDPNGTLLMNNRSYWTTCNSAQLEDYVKRADTRTWSPV